MSLATDLIDMLRVLLTPWYSIGPNNLTSVPGPVFRLTFSRAHHAGQLLTWWEDDQHRPVRLEPWLGSDPPLTPFIIRPSGHLTLTQVLSGGRQRHIYDSLPCHNITLLQIWTKKWIVQKDSCQHSLSALNIHTWRYVYVYSITNYSDNKYVTLSSTELFNKCSIISWCRILVNNLRISD